jgi:hypothetical protein
LVVVTEREPAKASDRVFLTFDICVVDLAAQLANQRNCRVHVVDLEEHIGDAPASSPWTPPGTFGVLMTSPPPGPGSKLQPNSAW